MVQFSGKEFKIIISTDNHVAREFIKHLPISSSANNIGGEIYFRVPGVDLPYDGTQREEFEIGDIVYWRSPIGEKKYSVAILFGNTSYGNWKSPRTSDPCIKIGRIVDDAGAMESIQNGENVNMIVWQIN